MTQSQCALCLGVESVSCLSSECLCCLHQDTKCAWERGCISQFYRRKRKQKKIGLKLTFDQIGMTASFWKEVAVFLQLQEGAESLRMEESSLQEKGANGLN